jgi:hypothetical protein
MFHVKHLLICGIRAQMGPLSIFWAIQGQPGTPSGRHLVRQEEITFVTFNHMKKSRNIFRFTDRESPRER